MPASNRAIRIAAALIAAAGLAACVAAIFPEQLGLGVQASPGTFGWRRMVLLVVGGVVFAVGALLVARPGVLFTVVDWEQMHPLDQKVRIVGALLATSGAAASGVAIFAEQLGLGAEAARGEFGWKQISLLAVGAVVLAVGAALMARPQIAPRLVGWVRSRATREHWARIGRQLRSRLLRVLSVRVGKRARSLVDLAGLLFVLGVYAAVQFTYRKPPSLEGGDQLDYFATADELPDASPTHRHLRLGLLFPVRGFIEIFGYSEAAYYAVPFLSGLALAGFTYLLARMLFGWAVGVAAALLVTLNPYVLWDSSHLLPDVPAAAALAASITALVGAGILHLRSRVDARTAALLVAGGFLLGWAYLTREYLLVAFPIVLVVFFAYRIPWRRLGWVALGLAPPLILEVVWGAVNDGDPLTRFMATAVSKSGAPTQPESYVMNAWDIIWQLPSLFLGRSGGWIFVALFFGIVLYGSVAAIRGDRRFIPIVAWAGGLWLVLTIIGLVPIVTQGESAFLRLQKFRYWLPIMPGLVIGGLAVARELIRILATSDEWARPLGLASLAAITVVTLNVGISSISHSSAFIRNGSDQYLELRDFLREEGGSYSSLYTDHGTGASLAVVLPMYTRTTFGSQVWYGEIRALASETDFLSVDEIDGDLVVVRPRSIRWLIRNRAEFSAPRYLLDPPPNWEPVLIAGGVVAYSLMPTPERSRLHTVSGRDWHIIEDYGRPPAGGVTIDDARTRIGLAADDSVLLFDRRGEDAGPPEVPRAAPIGPGGMVWGQIHMATQGWGRTSIRCYFYGQEGWTWIPAAARERYTDGLESIDYRCRAPETGGPFNVRVAVHAIGPVRLTVGDNAVDATQE